MGVPLCSSAVDFELSDDQRALQEAARDLLDREASSERVRAALGSSDGYDTKLWRAMVEQGWMGVGLGDDAGGLGLGTVETAVLLEEIGRHTAPVPFLPSLLALGSLTEAAAAGVAEAHSWIGPLGSGETLGCVSWSRSLGAVRAGPDGSLSGRPDPVIAAPVADVAIIVAAAPDGPGLFAVDLGRLRTGRPRPEAAMDQTRTVGWLALEHTPATRLGGADSVTSLLDRASTGTSAELLGGAARVLEMTTEYAKQRVQFGRPIGSFQAVKHRCADMLVDVEGMRSVAYYAAWAVGASHPDASIAASTAKIWCSDAARRVMASGLQVHGGVGFTWEHDLHLYLKRSQLDQVSFGDAAFHRERLAALLRPRVERGESLF